MLVSLDCWPRGTRDGQAGSLSCPALPGGQEAGSDHSGVVSRGWRWGAPIDRVGRLVGVQVATARNHPEEQQKELQRQESFFWVLFGLKIIERGLKKKKKTQK